MTGQADESASPARLITVAIVDDHPVLRDGIASLLANEADMEVVALGASVADAEQILSTDVDVVLLDVRLGTQSGLSALQRSAAPRPAVVVLTAYGYPQYAEAALRLGASGFVLKNGPIEDLLARDSGGGRRRAAFRCAPRPASRLERS